jgi:folylpolyglutamate synthase/dihydropteroate synthase
VLGINRDKDARAVLRPLLSLARQVWATQSADNPRALPAAELARKCQRLGTPARIEAELDRALTEARAQADGLLCVTGSLMLVGQPAQPGHATPERLWNQHD